MDQSKPSALPQSRDEIISFIDGCFYDEKVFNANNSFLKKRIQAKDPYENPEVLIL